MNRYILYAVGEIILVVAGILIALQVNNWNESMKDRKIELKYLSNLRSDLVKDSSQLAFLTTIRETKVESALKLLNMETPITVDEIQEFNQHFTNVFLWYAFSPNQNTFAELVSSGNLKLLTNEQIKNSLLDLDQSYETLSEGRNHMRREYEHYLYDKLHLYIDLKENYLVEGFMESPVSWVPDTASITRLRDQLSSGSAGFLMDKTVRNGFFLAAANNRYLIDQYINATSEIEKLIQIIDLEVAQN